MELTDVDNREGLLLGEARLILSALSDDDRSRLTFARRLYGPAQATDQHFVCCRDPHQAWRGAGLPARPPCRSEAPLLVLDALEGIHWLWTENGTAKFQAGVCKTTESASGDVFIPRIVASPPCPPFPLPVQTPTIHGTGFSPSNLSFAPDMALDWPGPEPTHHSAITPLGHLAQGRLPLGRHLQGDLFGRVSRVLF